MADAMWDALNELETEVNNLFYARKTISLMGSDVSSEVIETILAKVEHNIEEAMEGVWEEYRNSKEKEGFTLNLTDTNSDKIRIDQDRIVFN